MSVKKESNLQKRIQNLIKSKGGYVHKMHGDMISEPGIPDLIACYCGYYIGIEVKVDKNKPSPAQGIHCRKIWEAGGIACIVWTVEEVEFILNQIDRWHDVVTETEGTVPNGVEAAMHFANIDDGRSW